MNDDLPVPRLLTSRHGHPAFRPDYQRVGVRIDGEERTDVTYYDADRLVYRTNKTGETIHSAEKIEPYWRFPENRQQRRARERWEAGRK